jgi:hypothetical protein
LRRARLRLQTARSLRRLIGVALCLLLLDLLHHNA